MDKLKCNSNKFLLEEIMLCILKKPYEYLKI